METAPSAVNRALMKAFSSSDNYDGEIRLSRLNKIFMFTDASVIRGYLCPWQQNSVLFQEHFRLLAGLTVYTAIILTAMQVGLGTDELKNNHEFARASYGSTVLSVLGPLILVVLFFLHPVFLFYL